MAYYLEAYTAGLLTAEERQELQLLLQDPSNKETLDQLLDADWQRWEDSDLQFPEGFARVQQAVSAKVRAEQAAGKQPAGRVVRLPRSTWAAAAAVLLLLAAGSYWWLIREKPSAPVVVAANPADIPPGSPGAILTLADGSQVLLDTIQQATIALQGGITATVVNGALVYEGKGTELLYNSMKTPRGRQYQLRLPDGTRVWLNAASSIRYPTVFTGSNRTVELSGEAYFEVTNNPRQPFLVQVNNAAAVEVLGTHFNINAYGEEPAIQTTLLEGSIAVSLAGTAHTGAGRTAKAVLQPGQQARIRTGKLSGTTIPGSSQILTKETGAITVLKNIDTDKVMAWKNGLFNFEGASLEEVMRQSERWYDIEVVYEKGIPDMELTGKMTRDVTLGQLLEGLELFHVHYRLEGRRLIILP